MPKPHLPQFDSSATANAVSSGGFVTRLRAYMKDHVRYEVIALIFVIMTINQADRATMSIAGTPMASDLGFSHSEMGWLFSSFAWSYMLFQLVGGWAIDRFGAKPTYTVAILSWSTFTLLIGVAPMFGVSTATYLIFALIFLVGVAAAPCFPANAKIVAAWFPTQERGTASAIFNSTQYFAAAVFTPFLAFVAVEFGWRNIYYLMGVIGLIAGGVFAWRLRSPATSRNLGDSERELIKQGGATLVMDRTSGVSAAQAGRAQSGDKWRRVSALLSNRMLLGIYFSQYCISTLTFFFLTWFPVYLVQQRHIPLLHAGLMASVPAMCGFIGGLLGGYLSDSLLRRGRTLTMSRKLPIFVGMALSSTIILCNYVSADWMVLVFMAIAFFGKGMGALGWAVVADTSPTNAAGLNASIFNTFGSLSGITTPIVIGYIVQRMHSFNGALIFVGAHAILAVIAYAFVVGKIQRVPNV